MNNNYNDYILSIEDKISNHKEYLNLSKIIPLIVKIKLIVSDYIELIKLFKGVESGISNDINTFIKNESQLKKFLSTLNEDIKLLPKLKIDLDKLQENPVYSDEKFISKAKKQSLYIEGLQSENISRNCQV